MGKESLKSSPSGIRFDLEQLEFIQKREVKLNTKQKVVDYLLNKYWWEMKVNQEPNHKGLPPIEVRDLTKPTNIVKPFVQPTTNYSVNTRTVDQWINIKRGLEYEEEYKNFYRELEQATNLTERQKTAIKLAR